MGGTLDTVRKGDVRLHRPSNGLCVVLSSDAYNWSPRYDMIHVAPVLPTSGLDPVTVPLTAHDPVQGFVHVDLLGPVGVDELGEHRGRLADDTVDRLDRSLMTYFDLPPYLDPR